MTNLMPEITALKTWARPSIVARVVTSTTMCTHQPLLWLFISPFHLLSFWLLEGLSMCHLSYRMWKHGHNPFLFQCYNILKWRFYSIHLIDHFIIVILLASLNLHFNVGSQSSDEPPNLLLIGRVKAFVNLDKCETRSHSPELRGHLVLVVQSPLFSLPCIA